MPGFSYDIGIQAGDTVIVPKGTPYFTTMPGQKYGTLGKTMMITVDHIHPAIYDPSGVHSSSGKVVWAGRGRYWKEVEADSVKKI